MLNVFVLDPRMCTISVVIVGGEVLEFIFFIFCSSLAVQHGEFVERVLGFYSLNTAVSPTRQEAGINQTVRREIKERVAPATVQIRRALRQAACCRRKNGLAAPVVAAASRSLPTLNNASVPLLILLCGSFGDTMKARLWCSTIASCTGRSTGARRRDWS